MKHRYFTVTAVVILAATFLASCSSSSQPLGSAVSAAPSPSPASSISSAPPPSQSPQPSPSATMPPVGLQHSLPPPLPTASAVSANAPLDADDYYVVSQNGRKCVVDRNGKMVLPPNFVQIDIVSETAPDSESEYGDAVTGKALFFAVPSQDGPAGARLKETGFLYGASGKMVTSVRLGVAQASGQDLIEICREKDCYLDDEDAVPEIVSNDNTLGAILYSGRLVIPYQYQHVFQFGKTGAALRVDAKGSRLDFYDLNGKKFGSVPVFYDSSECYSGYYSGMIRSCGNLIIVKQPGGKLGILDENLQWVAQPEWDDILYDDSTGQFVVMKGNKVGVMNPNGRFVIQPSYERIEDSTDSTNYIGDYCMDQYYTLKNVNEICLLDSKGNMLFRSSQYNYLTYSNGVIIAQQAHLQDSEMTSGKSDLYDLQGNFLISIADDIDVYYPQYGYFASETKVYDSNGGALLLPRGGSVTCITADRFIVYLNDQSDENSDERYGMCDARGKWIIQPDYLDLESLGGHALLYTVEDYDAEYGQAFGLADLDGHILTDPLFLEFENYQGALYNVTTATMSGLMDKNLKWVWNTTIYDGLWD